MEKVQKNLSLKVLGGTISFTNKGKKCVQAKRKIAKDKKISFTELVILVKGGPAMAQK